MLLQRDEVRTAQQLLLQCDKVRTAQQHLLQHVLAFLGNFRVQYIT
jgi:hypothetical protein